MEFILPLPTAAGVVILRDAVLVSAWAAWVVLALASKVGHSSLAVRTLGEHSRT